MNPSEIIVRMKWKCDTIYRVIEAKDHMDAIQSIKAKHRLINVEPTFSSGTTYCNLYGYTATIPSNELVEIEIVEFNKPGYSCLVTEGIVKNKNKGDIIEIVDK